LILSAGNASESALRPGFLPRGELQRLLDLLGERGYRCLGPVAADDSIVYRTLSRVAELPRGLIQIQQPGRYRLLEGDGERLFAWANGPQALKPLLFAPEEPLWRAERGPDGRLEFSPLLPEPEPLAVLGVRACDLAALALLDRHFLQRPEPDPWYERRRRALLLIGVDCSHPADTCFCVSTGDGPALASGFDLGLSEIEDGFLVTPGSAVGSRLAADLGLKAAAGAQLEAANAALMTAAAAQTRALPGRHLRDPLFGQLDHGCWQAVAERCLACGNCTAVCPTCFCFTEHSELGPDRADQQRRWGSCFSGEHGAVHGRAVRESICARYRQWVTHKLAGWHDQYGRSGCVGCGRCLSWCPVAIDLTAEVAAICGGLADD
jgi:ferredoxin